MEAAINNIDDLRREIQLLQIAKTNQEIEIKKHFSNPFAVFNTAFSFFSKSFDGKGGLAPKQDVVSLVSGFVIPYILNKTFFRHSNIITKAVVGLLSQKASPLLSINNISSIWDKITGLIPKRRGAKKPPVDYGIPPSSESF